MSWPQTSPSVCLPYPRPSVISVHITASPQPDFCYDPGLSVRVPGHTSHRTLPYTLVSHLHGKRHFIQLDYLLNFVFYFIIHFPSFIFLRQMCTEFIWLSEPAVGFRFCFLSFSMLLIMFINTDSFFAKAYF